MPVQNNVKSVVLAAQHAGLGLRLFEISLMSIALLNIADALRDNSYAIVQCNRADIGNAIASGCSSALIDRLSLDTFSIEAIAESVVRSARITGPLGDISDAYATLTGRRAGRVCAPLGAIAVIYDAWPSITIDAACFALKSGNAIVLHGGAEATETNKVLVDIIREALLKTGINESCVQYLDTPGREAVEALIELDELIDVFIPLSG